MAVRLRNQACNLLAGLLLVAFVPAWYLLVFAAVIAVGVALHATVILLAFWCPGTAAG